MKNHVIKGLYELQTTKKNRAIVFSVINKDDSLRYEYYMLIIDRKGNRIFSKVKNPILLARENKLSIQRVSQSSEAYREYIQNITDFHIDSVKYPTHKEFDYGLKLKNRA